MKHFILFMLTIFLGLFLAVINKNDGIKSLTGAEPTLRIFGYASFTGRFGPGPELKEIFEKSFQAVFSVKTFLNVQTLDFEGLRGRLLSSSYMPSETDARFKPMLIELQRLFEKYAESGKIQILYNTNIFYTRL